MPSPGNPLAPLPYKPNATTQPMMAPQAYGLHIPAQAKMAAPPVYKPNSPQVTQAKLAPPVYKPGATLPRIGVPPVYRPNLPAQAKVAMTPAYKPNAPWVASLRPTSSPVAIRPRTGPPVYRPQISAQAKMAAPPVYRPTSSKTPQALTLAPLPARVGPTGASMPLQKRPAPVPAHPPRSVVPSTIQRTIYQFKGGVWTAQQTATTDTDTHPTPDAYCTAKEITPADYDRYDRNAGEYYKFQQTLAKKIKSAKKRKVPANLSDQFPNRENTAYGKFYVVLDGETENRKMQGPHIFAFSAKQAMLHMQDQMGGTITDLLGSKLIPPPRQALQMLQDLLTAKGHDPHAEPMLKKVSEWYKEYKSSYNEAKNPTGPATKKRKMARDAAAQAVENHPLGTYEVGGRADDDQMKGKGERIFHALEDLGRVSSAAAWVPVDATSKIKSVDIGYLTSEPTSFHSYYDDVNRNWFKVGRGEPASPSNYAAAPYSPYNTPPSTPPLVAPPSPPHSPNPYSGSVGPFTPPTPGTPAFSPSPHGSFAGPFPTPPSTPPSTPLSRSQSYSGWADLFASPPGSPGGGPPASGF